MNITVYGMHSCPYCVNVETFLRNKEKSYDYKVVGEDLTMKQLEETVGRPVRTVPVIVVDGNELTFDSLRTKVNMSSLSL